MISISSAKAGAAGLLLAVVLGAGAPAQAEDDGRTHIERQTWTFSGLLGKFDQAQLQRGFKVYSEVCSRCHGVKRLAFRNLVQPGGPSFSEAGVKSLAADKYRVDAEPNEQGKVLKRPAVLTDNIPPPFKNEQEARSVQPGGALPPDLSLIARARGVESETPFYLVPLTMLRDILSAYQEAGVDYLYAYLTGYKEPPPGAKVPEAMNYNAAFPAPHFTGMPNPFAGGDGLVTYTDGTPATVDNYARDVASFLAWAADPRLEERKRLGIVVIGYLLITAILFYFAKRRIWSKAH
ncbi:MAG: cytochrome c1 [Hyphomicrobiaceae bacterium]|nr:cytochrome c1 [Hyphomicrobiaceae bacterium]